MLLAVLKNIMRHFDETQQYGTDAWSSPVFFYSWVKCVDENSVPFSERPEEEIKMKPYSMSDPYL